MAWQAPTTGSAPLANHVNQFLVTHPMQVLYAGTVRAAQTTVGAGNTLSNGTWIAQSFTTAVGQTTIGYVIVRLYPAAGNTSPPTPITIGIYANSAGAPTGAALVSTTVSQEHGTFAATSVPIPLPITGLTASTQYWIVTQANGTATSRWQWDKSNQVSGTSTSANGTTWAAQAYGSVYQVFDQTVTGAQTFTWEDSGARWTWTGYNTNGTIKQLSEYTLGQTSTGYLQSDRTLSYSAGEVTGVV